MCALVLFMFYMHLPCVAVRLLVTSVQTRLNALCCTFACLCIAA